MKIIKVSTELEMSVHEFPEGTMREQNKVLYGLIGNGCDLVEHVMPKRLYTELKMPSSPVKEPGKCVSMLIDEEGRLKPNKANLIGSYLYEFQRVSGRGFVDVKLCIAAYGSNLNPVLSPGFFIIDTIRCCILYTFPVNDDFAVGCCAYIT